MSQGVILMSRGVDLLMSALFRTRWDMGFLCSKHLKYCEVSDEIICIKVTGHKAQYILQLSWNYSGWKRHPRSSPAVNPAPPRCLWGHSRLTKGAKPAATPPQYLCNGKTQTWPWLIKFPLVTYDRSHLVQLKAVRALIVVLMSLSAKTRQRYRKL